MSKLTIPLAEISDEGREVDETVDAEDLRPQGAKQMPASGIRIAGTVRPFAGVYRFDGVVSGHHHGECDWTGEHVEAPFRIQVEWTFFACEPGEEPQPADSETVQPDGTIATSHTYDGSAIDLREAAWEEVVLSRPVKFMSEAGEAAAMEALASGEREGTGEADEAAPPGTHKALAKLGELFPGLRAENRDKE